jgi:hypothetical protein
MPAAQQCHCPRLAKRYLRLTKTCVLLLCFCRSSRSLLTLRSAAIWPACSTHHLQTHPYPSRCHSDTQTKVGPGRYMCLSWQCLQWCPPGNTLQAVPLSVVVPSVLSKYGDCCDNSIHLVVAGNRACLHATYSPPHAKLCAEQHKLAQHPP